MGVVALRFWISMQNFFLDMLKIVRKSGFDPIVAYFRTIIYISKKNFLHWNSKSECYNSQILCTKNFIKFLLQDKKLSRLQNPNFVIFSKKMSPLRKSPHMGKGHRLQRQCSCQKFGKEKHSEQCPLTFPTMFQASSVY